MRQQIRPPHSTHPIFVSHRLLLQLSDLVRQKRLIVLNAPTGFGKSVLMASFAISTPLPVCWYSLSERERDPFKFLNLLAFGLSDRFISLRERKVAHVMAGGNVETNLEYLIDILASLPPHLLIFDDVFCVEGIGFSTVMAKLLNSDLPHTQIMMGVRSRAGLDLGTALNYVERDIMGGLGEDELAIRPEECRIMLSKWFGVEATLDEADEITLLTGGNIARILALGQLGTPDEQIRSLKSNLVAHHIIDGMEYGLQQFLLRTVALPYLTAELCQELGVKNAPAYIARLQDIGLVAQSGHKFFFAESIANTLKDMMRVADIITAARILEGRGDYVDAGELLAGNRVWGELAAMLGRGGRLIYDSGHAQQLGSWLSQLPPQKLDDKLKLLYGRVLVNDMGQPGAAMDLFEKVRQQGTDRAIRAQARVWQSVVKKAIGEPAEALIAAIEGADELRLLEADPDLTTQALRILGHAYRATGNLNMHTLCVRRALGIYEGMGDHWGIAQSHHDLGVGLAQLGQVESARYHFNQAALTWQRLGASSDLANTLNSLGMNYYLRGEYDLAESHLQDSLGIALHIQATRRVAFALSGLGDVALARGDYKTGLAYFGQSAQNAQRASARALEVFNAIRMGECYLLTNEIDRAIALADLSVHMAHEKKYALELGLAYSLQGQIYLRRGDPHQATGPLRQAVNLLGQADRFEEIRARLWLALALLRDLRQRAARRELDTVLALVKELPGLIGGLQRDMPRLADLLGHFYQSPNIPDNIKDGLILLGYRPGDMGVQFYGFGDADLVVNGRHWQFSSRWRVISKTPELLSYILIEKCRRGGCHREAIQAALWPDTEPTESYDYLRQNIKRLQATQFEDYPQGSV